MWMPAHSVRYDTDHHHVVHNILGALLIAGCLFLWGENHGTNWRPDLSDDHMAEGKGGLL